MRCLAVACAPIRAAVEELVDVAVAAASGLSEGVRTAANVGDGGLISCCPVQVIYTQAANWPD